MTIHLTYLYLTERVLTAINSLRDSVIYWPDTDERRQISRRFRHRYGLPGTVGIIDGAPVNLMQRPHIDGEVYWTRIFSSGRVLIEHVNGILKSRFFVTWVKNSSEAA